MKAGAFVETAKTPTAHMSAPPTHRTNFLCANANTQVRMGGIGRISWTRHVK